MLTETDGNYSSDFKAYWAGPREHRIKQNPDVFQAAAPLTLLLHFLSPYVTRFFFFFAEQWILFLSFVIWKWEQVMLSTGSFSQA